MYARLSPASATVRKAINKEMMTKIAEILELDDWRTLIDREELDALSKKEQRIKQIKEDMESYRSKIQGLQKELKKQKRGVNDD
jgi:5-bromo-4-chloroindolyl phosphate hydrolysis protein